MVDISAYVSGSPRLKAPPGTCDCHFHVYGPGDRYTFADGGERNLHPDASVAEYKALMDRLGVQRCVLVQPSAYGTDNRRTIDAVREIGLDRARGTIICSPKVTAIELVTFDEAGMRGIRVANLHSDLAFDDVPDLAERVAPMDWMIEMSGASVPDWMTRNPGLPVPMMIDHMARLPPGTGVNDPAFVQILRLLEQDNIWVKLSGAYYTSTEGPPFADVVPRIQALVAARPENLVWGTNWPHPQFPMDGKPDAAACLDVIGDAVADAAVLKAILVDNPARLYGFD